MCMKITKSTALVEKSRQGCLGDFLKVQMCTKYCKSLAMYEIFHNYSFVGKMKAGLLGDILKNILKVQLCNKYSQSIAMVEK